MTTIQKIRVLLVQNIEVSDELLELYIAMVTQRILNYTNQVRLPPALELDVLIPMVISMIDERKTTDVKDLQVASVSEAGRTVSFKQEEVSATLLTKISEKIKFYEDQMNKFRRLV